MKFFLEFPKKFIILVWWLLYRYIIRFLIVINKKNRLNVLEVCKHKTFDFYEMLEMLLYECYSTVNYCQLGFDFLKSVLNFISLFSTSMIFRNVESKCLNTLNNYATEFNVFDTYTNFSF